MRQHIVCQARFRRHSTHVPNLTDELSTAKERRLNQFGAAVLVWCCKSGKFDRVCRTFVELNLGSTHGAPSESDDAPVSLQSRTYSIRFGTRKVRRLNQASHKFSHTLDDMTQSHNLLIHSFTYWLKPHPWLADHNLKLISSVPMSSLYCLICTSYEV